MIKGKKYDWKDSNVALFGSDLDKGVKKEAALCEPAWEGVGLTLGLKIWRIVNFKVTDWPKEDYGKFYEGDSYIILNTFKDEEENELKYDVHFWIGKYSSQDEYGTAAYKTVEVDAYLDDKPIQHREVMKFESRLFKSYFKNITYLKGGADSGFRHIKPEEYKHRLFQYNKVGKNIEVKEVSLNKDSLHSNDVFILDMGLRIIQWNGSESAGMERYAAAKYIQDTENERARQIETTVIDEHTEEDSDEFYNALHGEMDADDDDTPTDTSPEVVLYRLSDSSGVLCLEKTKTGPIHEKDLCSDDVFLIDTCKCVFVWIGKAASVDERRNSLSRTHEFLKESKHPYAPVAVYSEGDKRFWKDLKQAC